MLINYLKLENLCRLFQFIYCRFNPLETIFFTQHRHRLKEWRRRQRAKLTSPEFSRHADFWQMLRRKGRPGARFFPRNDRGLFDDVQFFTPRTLVSLLRYAGFGVSKAIFSGFLPPQFLVNASFEDYLARIPFLKQLGYFYLLSSFK